MFWGGGITNNKHPEQEIIKNENVNLAIYLENEQTTSIPSNDSGYYFDREKSSCTNDAYINWDSVSWSPVIKNAHNYPVRCELHFTTIYNEGILNGTDPILKDELIPVEIEDDGTVKKADLTKPWYSYAKQKWANAVITQNSYDALINSGDVHGATKNDGYVSFDGVDDYIDLGLENYDFGNGLTFSINFSLNNINSSIDNDILGNWHTGGGGIYVNSNGELVIEFYMNGSYERVFTGKILKLHQDYQLVTLVSKEKISVYLNNNLISERSIKFEYVSSMMPIIIGANPEEDINYGYADIDVKIVQIYNRAIAENEVVTVSNGKVMDDTGLLRYLDFTNKTNYETNEIIPESVIESYFVWIPKYRYKLWDLGTYDSLTEIDTSKVHEIPIIFGDYNTSDNIEGECTTPMESGVSGNCNIGDYMTHPAFLSIPSKGFWVGKFETSRNGGDSDNIRNGDAVQIKPNVSSWRSIQVANAFYSSYDYKRNLDSHMMKNTEWGAVAYLQHSKYGSQTSVRLNNNSSYITGYTANNEPTCGYTATNEECNRYCNDGSCNTAYPNKTADGQLSSTTNNVSGVFDMSGGAWEYVMGVMLDQNGNPMSGRNSKYNSEFNGTFGSPSSDGDTSGLNSLTNGYEWPEKKYYDTYAYGTSNQQYLRRILGDATDEMGPFANATYFTQTSQIGSWYSDLAKFVYSFSPWLIRSIASNYGLNGGAFSFSHTTGHEGINGSFRLILTPS